MKRYLTPAAAAALLVAALVGGAGTAAAQDGTSMSGRRAGRFDLGVYAGGSITSRWFDSHTVTLNTTQNPTEGEDEGYSPGYAPAFGAFATFWLSPAFGVRAHGAYVPMRPPRLGDGFFDAFHDNASERRDYTLNTWSYDLDLVLRPFIMNQGAGRMLSSAYFFAGGGGYTVDLAGTDQPLCHPALLALGACLSYEPEQATVGQGTAGAGMDLFRVGRSLAVFGELGAHAYDSPVHTGDDFVGPVTAPTGAVVRVADDRVAVTPRLVIGLKAIFGDILPAPTRPPPPPMAPPPPPPPMVMPPPPPSHVDEHTLAVCVLGASGEPENVPVRYNTATGDTMAVDGRPIREAYPTDSRYAAGATWFINNDPVTFNGRRYVKYGLPRVLGATEVTRAGDVQGVGVFAEAGAGATAEVIYLPVRPGCEFQPYQLAVKTGGVRG
jgi:hypothetical protein